MSLDLTVMTSPDRTALEASISALCWRTATGGRHVCSEEVILKAGPNEILIKVCQNNQSEPWAQAWNFAVRVCDKTGGKLPLQQVVGTEPGETKLVPLGNLKPAIQEKK